MARKGENIYHRKDGRWEGRYKLPNETKYRSVYAKTYSECKSKRLEKIRENEICVAKTGFEKLCMDWLASRKNQLKESSYTKYDHIIRSRFLKFFGCGKVRFTEENLKDFIESEIFEKLTSKTINEHFKLLKQIAMFSDINNAVIFEKAKKYLPKQIKKKVKVMRDGDRKKLERYILKNMDTQKLGVYLAMTLGLRIGEVCALQWKDIDLEHGTIYIRKTMQRIQVSDRKADEPKTKVVITEPKTQSGMREIPLPAPIVKLLKNFLSADDNYILTSTEKYIEPRYLSKLFHKYTDTCGISAINFHALRHTFATRFVEKNNDYKALSEILGHSSPNITMMYYVHPSMNFKRTGISSLL